MALQPAYSFHVLCLLEDDTSLGFGGVLSVVGQLREKD